MPIPKVSVVIATYNRCQYLKDVLESLNQQDISRESFELIVVDNNSTDRTPEIVAEFCRTSGLAVRYIHESRQGLSIARNRGSAEAQGDIVAFIDDDAHADSAWLKMLLQVYDDFSDAGVAGGKIKLLWLVSRPSWLTGNLEMSYSALDYGDLLQELHFPRTPFGCNFSVKRSLFLELGGFFEGLGRQGQQLMGSEEVYFCHLVESCGKKVYYAPDAVVHHQVLPERVSRRYLFAKAYAQGMSTVLLEAKTQKTIEGYWKSDLSSLKNTVKDAIAHLLRRKHVVLAEDFFTIFFIIGKLRMRISLSQ